MKPNGAKPPNFSPRDHQLATLLAAGKTQVEAGTELKISRTTVQRIVGKEGFAKLVAEVRSQMASVATGTLLESARSAVSELQRLATASKSDAVRVSAARSILEFGLKFRTTEEIAAIQSEIEQLRNELAQANQPPPPMGMAETATPTAPEVRAPAAAAEPEPEPSEPEPGSDDDDALFGT